MTDLLVPMRLWEGAAILNQDTLTSPILDVRFFERLESLIIRVTSVAGVPALKAEYAISEDGVNVGSFDDNADLVADSSALTTPEGWASIPMPAVLAPYIQIKFTGLAANQADTLLTAVLYGRELH